LSTTSAPASPIHRPSSPLRVALPPVTKDRERASSIEQRQFFLTGVCLREYSVLRTSRQQREQDLGQVRNNDHTRTLNTHPPPPSLAWPPPLISRLCTPRPLLSHKNQPGSRLGGPSSDYVSVGRRLCGRARAFIVHPSPSPPSHLISPSRCAIRGRLSRAAVLGFLRLAYSAESLSITTAGKSTRRLAAASTVPSDIVRYGPVPASARRHRHRQSPIIINRPHHLHR
jgi:hypothetical protein